jgi:hypothetical protein
MPRLIDLTGRTFGRLRVVHRKGKASNGHPIWVCACECGNTAHILGASLKNGRTQSCGCLRSELTSANNKISKRKHRGRNTPELERYNRTMHQPKPQTVQILGRPWYYNLRSLAQFICGFPCRYWTPASRNEQFGRAAMIQERSFQKREAPKTPLFSKGFCASLVPCPSPAVDHRGRGGR